MQTLVHLLLRYGVGLVFVNVLAEQLGLPLPAIPTLLVAGALSRDQVLSSTHVMVAAVIASVLADWLWFMLGRRYGYRILRTLCRISLSPDSCVRDTEANFTRWGMRSLLFAKFIPGFSTVAPPLAGASKRGTAEFLIYDSIGSFIWAGTAVAVGRVFFRAIGRILQQLESLGWWSVVFILCALALVIIAKWYQRLRFYKQLRMARITVDELKTMLDRGETPVVLDVRTKSSRMSDARRIPNALVASPSQIPERVEDLPPHQEIILYCT